MKVTLFDFQKDALANCAMLGQRPQERVAG
jgi:hypothetical protein